MNNQYVFDLVKILCISLYNIGYYYQQYDDYRQAQEHFQISYDCLIRYLGEDHSITQKIQVKLKKFNKRLDEKKQETLNPYFQKSNSKKSKQQISSLDLHLKYMRNQNILKIDKINLKNELSFNEPIQAYASNNISSDLPKGPKINYEVVYDKYNKVFGDNIGHLVVTLNKEIKSLEIKFTAGKLESEHSILISQIYQYYEKQINNILLQSIEEILNNYTIDEKNDIILNSQTFKIETDIYFDKYQIILKKTQGQQNKLKDTLELPKINNAIPQPQSIAQKQKSQISDETYKEDYEDQNDSYKSLAKDDEPAVKDLSTDLKPQSYLKPILQRPNQENSDKKSQVNGKIQKNNEFFSESYNSQSPIHKVSSPSNNPKAQFFKIEQPQIQQDKAKEEDQSLKIVQQNNFIEIQSQSEQNKSQQSIQDAQDTNFKQYIQQKYQETLREFHDLNQIEVKKTITPSDTPRKEQQKEEIINSKTLQESKEHLQSSQSLKKEQILDEELNNSLKQNVKNQDFNKNINYDENILLQENLLVQRINIPQNYEEQYEKLIQNPEKDNIFIDSNQKPDFNEEINLSQNQSQKNIYHEKIVQIDNIKQLLLEDQDDFNISEQEIQSIDQQHTSKEFHDVNQIIQEHQGDKQLLTEDNQNKSINSYKLDESNDLNDIIKQNLEKAYYLAKISQDLENEALNELQHEVSQKLLVFKQNTIELQGKFKSYESSDDQIDLDNDTNRQKNLKAIKETIKDKKENINQENQLIQERFQFQKQYQKEMNIQIDQNKEQLNDFNNLNKLENKIKEIQKSQNKEQQQKDEDFEEDQYFEEFEDEEILV